MTDRVAADLREAYEALSDLTRPLCDACPTAQTQPTRCCYAFACEITVMVARQQWGVELDLGTGSDVPFLGPDGCVVAPHLRPHCTGHVCPEALSQAPQPVQQEYRDIRGYIARLEQRFGSSPIRNGE